MDLFSHSITSRKLNFKNFLIFSIIFSIPSFAYGQECVDKDGDGFGWNGTSSCRPSANSGSGSSDCKDDGDGDEWGWDGEKSCRISSNNSAISSSASNCEDDGNGDAWGWDSINRKSCRLTTTTSSSSNNSNTSPSNNCQDDGDGDEWGWDGQNSCRISSSNASNTSSSTNCQDDGNGDEWGWDGVRSCRITSNSASDSRPQTAQSNISNSAASNNSQGIYNQETVPEHLFYKKDCIKRDGNTIKHTWAEIPYRNYVVQHNVWNDSAVQVFRTDSQNKIVRDEQGRPIVERDNRGRISLCTELNGSPKNPKPRWYYDFLGEYDGQPHQVKAYPQVLYGRKIGAIGGDTGTFDETGLPQRINNIPNFKIDYKFSETKSGERNVAIESFFHKDCRINRSNQQYTATNQDVQFEMMVWVGRPTKRTGGTDKVGEARIDGADWEIYINTHLNWRYLAYVRKQTANEGVIDWNKFIEYTRNEVYKKDPRIPRLGHDECMTGIEMGTEIFFGKGDFTLDKFNVIRSQN